MHFLTYPCETASSVHTAKWSLADAKGGTRGVTQTLACEAGLGSYEIAFVACHHKEGKSWESIFIASDKASTEGISITWWNRRPGLAGQFNIKQCSQASFYDTVLSKAVHKGYEVTSYIGRSIPLTRRHSFIHELTKLASAAPALAFRIVPAHINSVGAYMAENCVKVEPIANFFQKLADLGHMNDVKLQLKEVARGCAANSEEVIKGFAEALRASPGEFAASVEPVEAPKPVTREERYSSWGAFG